MILAELEDLLTAHEGDAWAPALLAAHDDHDRFPAEAVSVLDEAGIAEYYVLTPDTDFTALTWLIRAVARRDLTVAIAHGKTFLGTAPVWVAGSQSQVDALAARVRAGEVVCWGLTERDHGADLLADEFRAEQVPRGWRLDGEKWLINNATRSGMACVLARTEPAGGARGFSLFLVDRRELPDEAWQPLPKVRTHGIRGADISGFTARGAVVGDHALVGEPGDGITVVLKTLQLTRVACAGLSLGAADHALRLARDFAAERELYGRTLADVPHVRRILGRAAAQALVAEAVSIVATRSVHALPGELSVTSVIAKAFVPTMVQSMLDSVAELLGVRGFLTGAPGRGFAKLERDHRICGIFDGSTVVNRAALLTQLPRLGRFLRRERSDLDGVRTATRCAAALPPFDRTALTLTSATGCSVVQSIRDAVARVPRAGAGVLAEVESLAADAAGFVPVAGGLPSEAFALAKRYERAYAIGCCLWLWLENDGGGPLWTDTLWLKACLAVLLDDNDDNDDDDGLFDAMASVLLDWAGPRFSLLEEAA